MPLPGAPEDTLYYWANRYVDAVQYSEEQPDWAHAEAELEYCEDEMRRHLGV